ncbi:MAG: nucleotidyl transferase AbiEii/AbiGii toxin family protein [Clostridiales bacterium]|nr:nucleotidyl transferase AbiEii/AbiGii toxin family protein [Clostridiales bacterium]
MINNAMQLKAKIKNFAKEKNLDSETVFQEYVLERFIDRISKSKYKNDFILKGGMLISSMVGVDLRSTLDIDTTIKGFEFTLDKLNEVLNEIIETDIGDMFTFKILMNKKIMEEKEYHGYRVTLEANFDTISQKFKIDISTGDIITPNEVKYDIKQILSDDKIEILAYNIETVLSEKVHSIIINNTQNSRARDYYDIYILEKLKKKEINNNILKEAIINKFKERGNEKNINNIYQEINKLSNNSDLKDHWKNYREKFTYAKDIEFEDTIKSLKNIVSVLNTQNQTKKFIKVTKKENLKQQEQESDDELEL